MKPENVNGLVARDLLLRAAFLSSIGVPDDDALANVLTDEVTEARGSMVGKLTAAMPADGTLVERSAKAYACLYETDEGEFIAALDRFSEAGGTNYEVAGSSGDPLVSIWAELPAETEWRAKGA